MHDVLTSSTHSRRFARRALAASVLAASVIPFHGASSVDAAILERARNEPYSYSFDNWCDRGTTDPTDDIHVVATVVGRESYVVRVRPNGEVLFGGHFDETTTYTNSATNRSWSSHLRAHEHDIKFLELDPATNTATVLTSRHDNVDLFDETGDPVAHATQLSQFTLIVDLDTLDVDFGDELMRHGPSDIGDFCDDAIRFTTS
jgi:hypothetical protein